MINSEENYRYRKLAIFVLAKALDDICPKFELEYEAKDVPSLINSRKKYFKISEKEIDKQWKSLESEYSKERKELLKSREELRQKILNSDNTKTVESKISRAEKSCKQRKISILSKHDRTRKSILKKLELLTEGTKRYRSLVSRLELEEKKLKNELQKCDTKLNETITRLKSTINTTNVNERLEVCDAVTKKKLINLKLKFKEKALIIENKALEEDQIRISIESFEDGYDTISHWCIVAGVPLLDCYTEVKRRMELVGRTSEKIDEIITNIKYLGEI